MKVLKAHLALLMANVIYGLNYVIAKGIMPDYLSPRSIIFLRVSGAVIFFWLVHLLVFREKVERKDLALLALCAFFGIATNQVMFFEGLNLTSPINASIIMVLVPILVLIISSLLIKERVTLYKVIGIALGTSGALVLILLEGEISFQSETFLGNIFVLINAMAFGLYLVLVKPLMVKYKPFTIMKWAFLFGWFFIFPFAIGKVVQEDWQAIPVNIWGSILYVVLATTIIAYLLYTYSLKHVSPVVTSSYIYLQPVLATIVALAFGKDELLMVEVISAVLIFTGVYFVSINRKPLLQGHRRR